MVQNLMAMIEAGGLGMLRNLWFKKTNLQDSRRATILISDYHGIIWVWIGMNVTSNTKKQVTVKAEEIMNTGYDLEGTKLGLNCRQLIIIDEYSMKAQDNQEVAQNYEQLLMTLDSLEMAPYASSNYIMEITTPAGQTNIQTTSQMPSSSDRDPRNDSLVGIMLICLLEKYPESFVSRKTDGSVQLETSSGETISYNYINFQLHLQPNSKPIPNEVMEKYKFLTQP
ncbi:MAG: hypothetical protein EAX96_11820 [Candidatus Lokiarchaeota archaeon]|nr:hypothetical protein [Candidatus Lokiarchaeota archaeon]